MRACASGEIKIAKSITMGFIQKDTERTGWTVAEKEDRLVYLEGTERIGEGMWDLSILCSPLESHCSLKAVVF